MTIVEVDTRRDNKFVAVTQALREQPYDEYEVVIIPKRKIRKLSMNRYYWGVLLATISEYTGHYPEELHELFAYAFNADFRWTKHGSAMVFRGSTKTMREREFIKYMQKIKLWALDFLALDIPARDQLPAEVAARALIYG